MTGLSLRAFGPEDILLPEVVRLNDAEVPRVSPLGLDGLRQHLGRCDLAVLAVDEHGVLAGFALAVAPGSDYASANYRFFEDRGTDHLYVDRVVVAPTHRRRGVGRLLYDAIEARARVVGADEVTCEVNLRPPNEGSMAFHRARGFVEVGRQETTSGTITVALLTRSLLGDRSEPLRSPSFEGPRREYRVDALPDEQAELDPLRRLRRWLDDAIAAEIPEPTAVTLATVDSDGAPDARIVLLRGLDERGVTWFTNRRSVKGAQIAAAPVAAVVAHWQPLERQVRLRGPVELLPEAESDAYFGSRPRASQLGAWASHQSEPITDRAAFEAQVAEVDQRFAGRPVPRPPHWGGYLLRPETIEFWQGRPARLHDRLRYRLEPDGRWRVERLQP